jgi:hypothetical protein
MSVLLNEMILEPPFLSLPLCYINSGPFRLDQALHGIQFRFPQPQNIFLCIHFQNVRKIFSNEFCYTGQEF